MLVDARLSSGLTAFETLPCPSPSSTPSCGRWRNCWVCARHWRMRPGGGTWCWGFGCGRWCLGCSAEGLFVIPPTHTDKSNKDRLVVVRLSPSKAIFFIHFQSCALDSCSLFSGRRAVNSSKSSSSISLQAPKYLSTLCSDDLSDNSNSLTYSSKLSSFSEGIFLL